MDTVKLTPAVKRPIWSGNKIEKWNKDCCVGNIGETWELSFLGEGLSLTPDKRALKDVVTEKDLGKNAAAFKDFPILIKFIDAREKLSIQVHPSDDYAMEHGIGYGKTEMWHVMECDEGAGLYLGFKRDTTRAEIEKAAISGEIEELLNFIPVKCGETYFVPAGTVHAIGAGVTLAEIQQNSATTYRVYDYLRRDKDGNLRELHLSSALDVLSYKKYSPTTPPTGKPKALETNAALKKIAECPYFTVLEAEGDGEFFCRDSFISVVCVFGSGEINGQKIKKGDTFFVPAEKRIAVKGNIKYLLVGVGL